MLLIGSRAAIVRGVQLGRSPSDTDVIATPSETRSLIRMLHGEREVKSAHPVGDGNKTLIVTKSLGRIEVETAWVDSTGASLTNWSLQDSIASSILCGRWPVAVPTGDVLLTLKMSHRYRKDSPHFNKTRTDILALRAAGFSVPPHLKDWLKQREKETYAYAHPKLNQSKMGFFAGDGVPYIYDHDSIHCAMAINAGLPAYTLYQKDGSEVAVDKRKWDALPIETQVASVVEESLVLALERSQIPAPGGLTPDAAFDRALMKVCTSITSGWWREFAWEHYDDARAMRQRVIGWRNYTTLFRVALARGIVIKPHQRSPTPTSAPPDRASPRE